MPKLGMGPIRRQQLVEAAITAIHEHGFSRTTVVRIAGKAGVAPGIVHHYFTSKDDLLFATMRSLLSDLRADTVARLRQAAGPQQRLEAIIDSCFGHGQFEDRVFSAWLALYGNARHTTSLHRIVGLYHRRLHTNLVSALLALVPRSRALEVAQGLGAMIDGLWLRYALTGAPADLNEPRRLAKAYLAGQLMA
jgi:TetR/AcrR family transcriptional repressor of bet genes